MNLEDKIKQRINEINNQLAREKRLWKKTEKERRYHIDTAPTYGNEFDYSHEMNYEDQKKLIHMITGREIDLKDERLYLKSLLKGRMPEFPRRYRWG